MPYSVKPIDYPDYIEAVKLFRASCKESRYKDYSTDEDKFIDHLNASVENPDANLAVVCLKDDTVIGMYIANTTDLEPFNIPIGMEWGFYVYPEYRGTPAAKMLQEYTYVWMKDRKVNRLLTAIHFKDDNSKTYQFCEHMGMREVGRIFERIL